MDPLKLLSLGAIALAVSACVVVYILHRQTTARLDALTQANMGITHTLHQLIASSMPRPQSQDPVSSQGQALSQEHPGGSDNSLAVTRVTDADGNVGGGSGMSGVTHNRIVVSDDESSMTDSDDDSVDGGNTDTDAESDYESDESESAGEDETNDVRYIKQGGDDVQHTSHAVERFEELSDDDEGDDTDSCDSEEEDDGEDEDASDGDDDDSIEGNDDGEQDIQVVESNPAKDDIDLVAFLLPQSNPESNDIDIGIIPLNSKQKESIKGNTDASHAGASTYDELRHLKVEELRKMAVADLGMTEDAAKKVKKLQLAQMLADAAEKAILKSVEEKEEEKEKQKEDSV